MKYWIILWLGFVLPGCTPHAPRQPAKPEFKPVPLTEPRGTGSTGVVSPPPAPVPSNISEAVVVSPSDGQPDPANASAPPPHDEERGAVMSEGEFLRLQAELEELGRLRQQVLDLTAIPMAAAPSVPFGASLDVDAVQSGIRDQLRIVMYTGEQEGGIEKWCPRCNWEEVSQGAKAAGMSYLLEPVYVHKNQLVDGVKPIPYEVDAFPSYLFMHGDKVVDRLEGTRTWPQLLQRYGELLSTPVPSAPPVAMAGRKARDSGVLLYPPQPQVVPPAAINAGEVEGRVWIEQLIETLQPILGGGGTMTVAFSKAGPTVIQHNGATVTLQPKTTFTWSMKGSEIKLAVNPAMEIKKGLRFKVQNVHLSPTQVYLDTPGFFMPDFKLPVTK